MTKPLQSSSSMGTFNNGLSPQLFLKQLILFSPGFVSYSLGGPTKTSHILKENYFYQH
jgi:hypothetical protein